MNLSKWQQKHGKKVDGNKDNIKAHAIQWPHINMCMQNYMKKQTRYRNMTKIESNKPQKIVRQSNFPRLTPNFGLIHDKMWMRLKKK